MSVNNCVIDPHFHKIRALIESQIRRKISANPPLILSERRGRGALAFI
jgi:hypothetical protein